MKIFANLTLTMLAVIFLSIPLNAAITFEDNFTVISGGGGINYEFDNGVRQSGTAVPVPYVVWSDVPEALPYVTNAGPTAGELYMPSDGSGFSIQSRWSPNYNFTESGDFSVEVIFNRTGDDSWKAINICKDLNLGSVFDGPGFSFMLWPSGRYIIIDGGLNQEGVTGDFTYAELSYASNPILKIKFVVSQQGGFPSTGDALISLFINDKPYPVTGALGQSNIKFTHTHAGGYSNNYISIFADGAIGVDNLKVSTSSGNAIETSLLTGDADSGITNTKIYTHAVNLACDDAPTINGVTFDAAGIAMSGTDWEIRTETQAGVYGAYDILGVLGQSKNVSPQSLFLVTNVLFDGVNSGSLTLSGLSPGEAYTLDIYSSEFDYLSPNGRSNYFATSDGGITTIANLSSVGANNGMRISYQYIVPDSGIFSISATPVDGSSPIGWFAFSNINNSSLPPSAPTSISATEGIYSDKIHVDWPEVLSAQSYIVYRAENNDVASTNFAVEVISNYFDDVVPSIIIAKDYYYWVQSVNNGGISPTTGPALGFTKSSPPDTPVAFSPDENVVTSPVEFTASTFNDEGGFTFAASQWQVAADSGFSSIKWQIGENGPAVTSIFAPRISIPEGTNYWRVRYMNSRNTWSTWSDSNQFICIAGETQPGIFKDTFNVLGNGDINLNCNESGRQFGNVTPLNYIASGVTEIGSRSSNPGELFFAPSAGCSPMMNFESSGRFNIEFDVKLHNFDQSTDWLSLGFGKDNQSDFWPISSSGLSVMFSAAGTFNFLSGTLLMRSVANVVPTAKEFHVLITTSTEDFYETDSAYCSVFIDGVPMVNNDTFPKYSYTLESGLANNYITMLNFNNAGTSPTLIDNFEISAAPTNIITVHEWTGDSDSLIEPSKEYTHLVNLNGDTVTINGHDFIGTGIITNDAGYGNGNPIITKTNWALTDAGNWTAFRHEEATITLGGGSGDLGKFGIVGGGSPAIVLSGLTPYSSNTLYLYSQAYSTYAAITFPSSYGGAVNLINVDQFGLGSGIIIQYDYVADENGTFTVMATPDEQNNRMYIAGFANEETGVSAPQLVVDNILDFGEVVNGNDKSLLLKIANTGGGIVEGIISGTESPFSLSTNSYYSVPGTKDNILITFSPVEERGYTNVITLSGSGGTAEVTLYGDGIPEPTLFLILNFGFWICISYRFRP